MWTILVWGLSFATIFYVFMKLTNAKCRSYTCLVGKVAIVTGGNSGNYIVCLIILWVALVSVLKTENRNV